MMKLRSLFRIRPLLILFGLSLLSVSYHASASDSASGINRMVRQIEDLFPVLEGYVLSVKGDRVTIDLKRGQNIQPGKTLKLIRFGAPITHPVTKAIVGREESDLGQIQVFEVRKDYSLARVITSGVTAKKGDGVRSTFKKIKILVAPVQSGRKMAGSPKALELEIESHLKQRTRFEVPAFDLGVWLLENGIGAAELTSPAHLQKLNKKIVFDYILLAGVKSVQGKTVMSYRLVSSQNGQVVKQSKVLIDAMPTAAAPASSEQQVQSDLRAEQGLFDFVGRHDFDFELVDFTVGDLTGKGKNDFVLIDSHRVMIYRYRKGQFRQLGEYALTEGVHKFLSVDVGDINGNGRDEIFVTSSLGDRLGSFILEAVPGKKGLVPIQEQINRYIRVLRDFDGPPRLIAQSPGFEKSFDPKVKRIHQMHFKNGEYRIAEELPLLIGKHVPLTLYGLAQGRLSEGKALETIFLDNNYHLRVYSSGGRLLVSSEEYFGHDPRTIEVGLKEVIGGKPKVSNPQDDPDRPKGRIQLVPHNARKFVLVPKNHRQGSFLSRLVLVKSSSLAVFESQRDGLKKLFETKKQPGYGVGYQAIDTASGHKQVHIAAVATEGGLFSSKTISTIYTYNWGR